MSDHTPFAGADVTAEMRALEAGVTAVCDRAIEAGIPAELVAIQIGGLVARWVHRDVGPVGLARFHDFCTRVATENLVIPFDDVPAAATRQ